MAGSIPLARPFAGVFFKVARSYLLTSGFSKPAPTNKALDDAVFYFVSSIIFAIASSCIYFSELLISATFVLF